jgi:hypothetical protein
MAAPETTAHEASSHVTLSEIRCADSALCVVDLHAFLAKSPGLSRALRTLKGLVSSDCNSFPNTSHVLNAEKVSFAPVAKHQRTQPLQAIRTPTCLVAVIREHLQHYKNKSTKLKYHSVRDQAYVFANAFSKTFPHLWHKGDVCGLLATSLQDFTIGSVQDMCKACALCKTCKSVQDMDRMREDIQRSTKKRCRVSDPEKLRDLHSKTGTCVQFL